MEPDELGYMGHFKDSDLYSQNKGQPYGGWGSANRT